MDPFYLEMELEKPICDYLKNQGFIIRKEIKIGYCRADVIGFKDDVVVSVELKLQNWKKAIIQAKNYQLASDFVYIAFPLLKTFNILRKAEDVLKKEGIGLLSVNENNCEVRCIIQAKKSNKIFCRINIEELNRNFIRNRKKKFFY